MIRYWRKDKVMCILLALFVLCVITALVGIVGQIVMGHG